MLQTPKKADYFYELDLLRFLAALSVVLFHYTFLNATESDSVASYPMLSGIFKYGYLGVELFFIISGFVILLTAAKKDWQGFVVSRVARLYPAFWVAVTLTTLFVILLSSQADISVSEYLWNLTMLGNLVNVENIDPVYWTLQVELKFYFWVFIILSFKKLHQIELFIFGWLIVSLLEIFHIAHDITHFLLIPEWAPYFSAGALYFRIYLKNFTLKRILLLVFAYLLSTYFALQGVNEKLAIYGNDFSTVPVLFLITFFYVLFLLISTRRLGFLRHRFFAIIGVTTYPLYLIHQRIGQLVYETVSDSINKYLLLVLLVSAMILLSFVIHKYVESRSILWLKRRLGVILKVSNKKIIIHPP